MKLSEKAAERWPFFMSAIKSGRDEVNPNKEGWHLDKRVNAGHIFTTIALIVSVMSMLSDFDKRIALVERENSHITLNQNEIKTSLKELNTKMDGIALILGARN